MTCVYGRRRAAMSVAVLALATGAPAEAEYQDPFHCRPPMGQGLFEIGANNMAFKYRREATAANKQTMCNSYRKVIAAYVNAVSYCRQNTCTTAEFREICAEKQGRLHQWREKNREACGARR